MNSAMSLHWRPRSASATCLSFANPIRRPTANFLREPSPELIYYAPAVEWNAANSDLNIGAQNFVFLRRLDNETAPASAEINLNCLQPVDAS